MPSADRPDLREASLRVIAAGQAASGAFVASPTFSQHRFAWLRDGAFVAEALDLVGELERSARFHAWVANVIVLGSADGLARAIVLDGERPPSRQMAPPADAATVARDVTCPMRSPGCP